MKKFFGVALVLAVAGCSESSTNTGDPGNPNPGPGTDGGSGNDGGNNNNNPETEVRAGVISLTQVVTAASGTEVVNVSTSASFFEGKGTLLPTGGTACTESTSGDCKVLECDTSSSGDAGATDAGTPKYPHAGEISIKGLTELKMTPDAKGTYSANQQTKLWNTGEDITVKAAGADVPAFEKVLKGPAAVTITAPTWPALGSPLEIDRAADFEVKWSDGGSGTVQAMLASNSGSKTTSIMCGFKADAGVGKIGKDALGKLITGGMTSLSLSAGAVEKVDAGDWKISINAYTPATANGNAATTLVTLK